MSLASITTQDPLAGFCIGRTISFEGGLVDVLADPGGVTNFGISLRFAVETVTDKPELMRWFDTDHDGHIDATDIRGLNKDEAADIYFAEIWRPGWYAELAPPQMLAWKCFDIAVNTGPKRAAMILQKALGQPTDAIVGPKTLAAAKAVSAKDDGATLLAALRTKQAAFYERLCVLEPKFVTFKKGWLARAAL